MTDGTWEYDETGFSQLYQALMIRKGSVPADADMGSDFWNIETIDSTTRAKAKRYMESAAQPLVDDGIISSFTVAFVDVNPDNPSRLDYGWYWEAGGESHEYIGNLAIGSA